MGKEYDCDKPPDAVLSCVVDQCRDVVETDCGFRQMGPNAILILFQVKGLALLLSKALDGLGRHHVQRIKQTRRTVEIECRWDIQRLRPTFRQHLPYTVSPVLLLLAMLGHLGAKVFGIENQPIEQKVWWDVGSAFLTLITTDAQYRFPAAGRTSLEYQCRIDFTTAATASAHALGSHLQTAAALGAGMPHQHHAIEELTGALLE